MLTNALFPCGNEKLNDKNAGKLFKNEEETNETKRSGRNETKQTTGEDTYAGALRAPRAGSPARLFRFVSSVPFRFIRFVFVFEKFPST